MLAAPAGRTPKVRTVTVICRAPQTSAKHYDSTTRLTAPRAQRPASIPARLTARPLGAWIRQVPLVPSVLSVRLVRQRCLDQPAAARGRSGVQLTT